MTAPQAGPQGPQHYETTARESAFYQAGFEAGRAQGMERAAAYAGAAASNAEAFTRSLTSIRQGLLNVDDALGGLGKHARPVRDTVRQAAELIETLRSSLFQMEAHFKAEAKASNEALQDARKRMAEQLTIATNARPRRRPGLLRRLATAVRGDQ